MNNSSHEIIDERNKRVYGEILHLSRTRPRPPDVAPKMREVLKTVMAFHDRDRLLEVFIANQIFTAVLHDSTHVHQLDEALREYVNHGVSGPSDYVSTLLVASRWCIDHSKFLKACELLSEVELMLVKHETEFGKEYCQYQLDIASEQRAVVKALQKP